jgi:outer membrane protein
MKNRFKFLAFVGLMMAGSALADTKIAVVNEARILQESTQAKQSNATIKSEFEGTAQEIERLQKELDAEDQDLQKNRMTMSESQLKAKQQALQKKFTEYQKKQMAFQQSLQKRQSEELNKLREKAYSAVVKISKDEGYDLVLSGGVIYSNPKLDITDQVLQTMGK